MEKVNPAAILGTLWAYDGWIGVTNMTGEIKNPEKKLPLIIGGGVIFVIAVYVAFNLAIFFTLPQDAIIASKNPGIDTANALFGPAGGAFISAGIMISVFPKPVIDFIIEFYFYKKGRPKPPLLCCY